jgi:hypothetical protein
VPARTVPVTGAPRSCQGPPAHAPARPRAFLDLGAVLTAPGCARTWTREILWERGAAGLADTAELVASELVTNSVNACAGLDRAVIRLVLTLDRGPFHFLPWNQVPEGQGARLLREVRCTWCGPLLYLGRHFRRSWPCTADARRWSANRFYLHARHGSGRPQAAASCARTRFRSGPGTPHWRPWSAESMSAAGAVCSRGSAARRALRGAGDGSTGTGKTWQPTGNGFAGHGSAGSRPVCSVGLPRCRRGRPSAGFRGWGRERSAELADRLAGFANLRPFHVASQSAC